MKNDEFVTLLSLNDPIKAEIIKITLTDHDVFCAIEGEHQAGLTGIFPIRILVPSPDLERATNIVREHHLDLLDENEPAT
jgi:hypothetical protein